MKNYMLVFVLLFQSIIALPQKEKLLIYPEEGKPMPDFTLRNIQYFSRPQAGLSDFKGRWLLLDFWNVHCGACVFSFPHVNEIQKQLGDKVRVMLVGIQDEDNQIQPMYAKFREREHLIMPCAFDSMVAKRFDIYAAPHSILIDDKGVVRCITTTFNVNDIRGFLAGHPPVTLLKDYGRGNNDSSASNIHFDPDGLYLADGNGGKEPDFVFRTIFSDLDGQLHPTYVPSDIKQDMAKGRFQAIGVPLEWLYYFAHFGQREWNCGDSIFYEVYNHPILETKDSSKFKYSFRYNRRLYALSVSFPNEMRNEELVKEYLRRQLSLFLGLNSNIEIRDCPVWALRAETGAAQKLRSRGGAKSYKQLVAHAGFTASNWPFSKVLEWIRINQPDDKIIFDETGILGNIDITMDCVPTYPEDLLAALKRNGLNLVKTTRPMKVLVIRDN